MAPASVSVEVGKTATSAATITPADATNQTVTAKSADETKATVAVAGKTLTITGVAATTDAVNVTVTVDGKTATLPVTVTAPAAG